MPDLFEARREILFRGLPRAIDNQKPLTRSGWQVTQTRIGAMLEPVDTVTEKFYNTEKEVTEFLYAAPEDYCVANSPTGGNVILPKA